MAILRPFQVARRQIIPTGDLANPVCGFPEIILSPSKSPNIGYEKQSAPDQRAGSDAAFSVSPKAGVFQAKTTP